MNVYEYTNNLTESLVENTYRNNGIIEMYEDRTGVLRLAREYAYGLKEFGVKCQDNIIGESYMTICYRYYQCKPPIKMNEWMSEICLNLQRQ